MKNDTEVKIHKCQSDEYNRNKNKVNINNLSNFQDWSDDDWEALEDEYNDDY